MIKQTHLYFGEGKGKTTAAIGLAVRAAGAGMQVIFAQFMKGNESSELEILKKMEQVTVIRPEKKYPFYKDMTKQDKKELTEEHDQIIGKIGCEIAKTFNKKNIPENQTDKETEIDKEAEFLVVLDELTYPLEWGLICEEKVKELLGKKEAEFVVTGRRPPQFLLELADYATEMKAVKHPYEKGLKARKGIEF